MTSVYRPTNNKEEQLLSRYDSIIIGAQFVNALQTIVSRQIDITRAPAVVTVGTFQSGIQSRRGAPSPE